MRGQVGTYLYNLLKQDEEVFGTTRGQSALPYLHSNLSSYEEILALVELVRPDVIYNLAGESNSHMAIQFPLQTLDINGKTVMYFCEVLKKYPKIKLFQACSSEMFKGAPQICITPENTTFYPKTPYAIAKVTAYWTIRYYREKYDLLTYNGFLFNTESPLRKQGFLTTKIAETFAKKQVLHLENLTSRKNWLHAKDVANAIRLCTTGAPGEYVFSTGITNSILELVEAGYMALHGRKIVWQNGIGQDVETGETVVVSDNVFRSFDQNEVVYGIDTKMQSLGWYPEYTLQTMMADIARPFSI